MVNEKIKKLESVLSENSSLAGSRQEHIFFSEFMLYETRRLQEVLFKEFGINGKRNALGLAVLYLLEDLKNNKDKKKIDGKEI